MPSPRRCWLWPSACDPITTECEQSLEELLGRLAELRGRRDDTIRLVCRTDRRSSEAARLLAEAGIANAGFVRGGMTAWRAKGWPVAVS